MFEEYGRAIEGYRRKWQTLAALRHNNAFFEDLQPTAVAWKVEDRGELLSRLDALRDLSDQIHFGWINERWLVTVHLKDLALPWDIRIIKLMERRPGSTDALGLDHVDFYAPGAKAILVKEAELKWTDETSSHCKWRSIWFADTEAKLRDDTVLQVCADEMLDFQQTILTRKK